MISGAVTDVKKAEVLAGCVGRLTREVDVCKERLKSVLESQSEEAKKSDGDLYIFKAVEKWCAVEDHTKKTKEFPVRCVNKVWGNPENFKQGQKRVVSYLTGETGGVKKYRVTWRTLDIKGKGNPSPVENVTTVADALKAAGTAGGAGDVGGSAEIKKEDVQGEEKRAGEWHVEGSASAQVDMYTDGDVGEETTLNGGVAGKAVYRFPNAEVGIRVEVAEGDFPSAPFRTNGALVDAIDQLNYREFYSTAILKVPLAGTLKAISSVDLVGANPMAARLEGAIKARLGKEKGEEFIYDVLRPGFALATDFHHTWHDIIDKKLPEFEKKNQIDVSGKSSISSHPTPKDWEVREGFWKKVEAVKGEWKALLGDEYEKKLKEVAEKKKVDYPFDVPADNPWKMQYNLNRFNAAAKAEGLLDETDWALDAELGWQAYDTDEPGFGLMVRVGTEWLRLSAYIMPWAVSNLANPDLRAHAPDPDDADEIEDNYFRDGWAFGVKIDGKVTLIERSTLKKWGLSYGLSAVSAGLDAKEGKGKDNYRGSVGTDLELQTGIGAYELSLKWEPRIRVANDEAGTVDYRNVLKADANWKFPRIGENLQLKWKNKGVLRLGTYGGDYSDDVSLGDGRGTRTPSGDPSDLVFDLGKDALIVRSALEFSLPDLVPGLSIDAGVQMWRTSAVNNGDQSVTQFGPTVGVNLEIELD